MSCLNTDFVKETLAVGLLTVAVGLAVSTPWMRASEGKWPSWKIQRQVAGSLFATGLLAHVVAEVSGVNSWYCKNGVACRRA